VGRRIFSALRKVLTPSSRAGAGPIPSAPLQMLCWRLADWNMPREITEWMQARDLLAEIPLRASRADAEHATRLADIAARIFAPFWLRRASADELAVRIERSTTLAQAGVAAHEAAEHLWNGAPSPSSTDERSDWAYIVCANAAQAVATATSARMREGEPYAATTYVGSAPELADVGDNLANCLKYYREDLDARAYPSWVWPIATATIDNVLTASTDSTEVSRRLPASVELH
jgi:hypothetical protein